MKIAVPLIAGLLLSGAALAQSNDDGFATRSVTGLGLTGTPSSGTPVPNSGAGAVSAPTPGTNSGASAGTVGGGTISSPGIGMGASPPAPGGGSFGSTTPRR